MTDTRGVPLEVIVSPANDHDVNYILPLVFLGLPSVGGLPGRPRQYPKLVRADRGYASQDVLWVFQRTRITADIPQRNAAPSGLGKRRWPIERTLSWLKQYRRVGVRRERLALIYDAFVTMACALITYKQLVAATL